MTGKRYYLGNGELYTICDSSKGGSDFFNMLTKFEVVDLLNALNDENEQLKNICKNIIHEVNKRGITVTMTDNCKELLE